MEFNPVIAFKLRLQLASEITIAVEPRHFVFVFVGQQLEIVEGHRFCQYRKLAGEQPGFGVADPLNLSHIALGVGCVLIVSECIDIGLDPLHLIQHLGLLLLGFRVCGQFYRCQVMGCTTAPQEGLLIEVDRDAIEFDGFLDGCRAERKDRKSVV